MIPNRKICQEFRFCLAILRKGYPHEWTIYLWEELKRLDGGGGGGGDEQVSAKLAAYNKVLQCMDIDAGFRK